MRNSKLLLLAGSILLVLIMALMSVAPGCAKPAPAPSPTPTPAAKETIEITVVDVHGKPEMTEEMQFQEWMRRVTVATGSRVTFKYLGGTDVIPRQEQIDSLGKGLVDVVYNIGPWCVGTIPEAYAFGYVKPNSLELRKSGFHDLVQEIFAKYNVHYVMAGQCSDYDEQEKFLLKVPITKPEDLKGLRIRGKPDAVPLIEFWGASPVMVETSEVYAAVERGMVDGVIFPATDILFAYSLQDVLKYYVRPGFYRASLIVAMNLDKWKALPADIQKVIDDEAQAAERAWLPVWTMMSRSWNEELDKAGMQAIRLSEADGKRLADSAYKVGWDLVLQKAPEYGPKLKELSGG